jgi:nucleoside-triphosphatase THEP1
LHKLKIKITATTDVSKVLENLIHDFNITGISNAEQRDLHKKVESEIIDLARRGQELSSIGSQFQVKRVIESETFRVVLDVDFRSKQPNLISKLRSLFSKD